MDLIAGACALWAPCNPVAQIVGLSALGLTVLKGKGKRDGKGSTNSHDKQASQTRASQYVTLTWENLTCTLQTSSGTRTLLSNLNGQAKAGRLLAILGSSGSGKTTLLTALAGQLPYSAKLKLSGNITINDTPLQESSHRQAFVQQDDLFFSMLTVRETLALAAELRLPPGISADERSRIVDETLQRLGLATVQDTRVGDAKTRGLSGGEKKRLAIACELISSPMLIFADESTSGLDAGAAEKVVKALKDLTTDGHTVICSIHQPRSSIFAMFDDLLLLADGREVYHGAADQLLPYLADLGHMCPEHYNPAEFAMDLLTIDYTTSETTQQSRERVDKLVQAYASHARHQSLAKPTTTQGAVAEGHPVKGPIAQLKLLFGRSWRQITRDKANLVARAMSNISSAVVFGSIFWRMGRSQSSIQDRMGLLQVSAVGTAMTSMIKTLNVFPTERTIINRERSKQAYKVFPYLLGKLGAELPIGALFPALFGAVVYPATGLNKSAVRFARFLGILTVEAFTAQALGLAVGAAAPSESAALAIGPAVMLIFIVFGGLYVTPDNVPLPLRWLPKASLIRASYQALCINEFQGMDFDNDAPGALVKGDQVLQRMGVSKDGLRSNLVTQGRLLVTFYLLTFRILKHNKSKFQPLEQPQINGAVAVAAAQPDNDTSGAKA